MTAFYYADNSTRVVSPEKYFYGQRGVTLPSGYNAGNPNGFTIVRAIPSEGLYEATEDPTQCDPPDDYDRQVALELIGTVGEEATRVVETVTCVFVAIDQLLSQKLDELEQISASILGQGVDVNVDGAVRPVQTTVEWNTDYCLFALSGENNATDRDYIDMNGQGYKVRKNNIDAIITPVSTQNNATLLNRRGHEDALRALHAANDDAGLSAYDSSTGWPAAPTSLL